jgi:hypothetical protein
MRRTTSRLLAACFCTAVGLYALTGCGASVRAAAAAPSASASQPSQGPIVITAGGTYSGNWVSNNWQTPAVQILTTDPVTLRNATISSRGDLISIPYASSGGANVTITNVTGKALDPGVAGVQRGSFVVAEGVTALSVKHCTMSGVRFGVKLLSSSPTSLSIADNLATNLEDRTSDGAGGFQTSRPDLGHFVMLNGVSAPNGADISWNQVVNTMGQSSTEDVFNIYKSEGSPSSAISVHDNYMEGNSSPAVSQYTGTGLITDGDGSQPETAYVAFTRNQVVHTAGSGVEIAAGHDISVSANRVVSCGVNSNGSWYAAPFVNAVVVWNYYGDAQFSNIAVQGTIGGMARPDGNGNAMVADIWVRTSDLDATDKMGAQSFTDPCFTGSFPNANAEAGERTYWQNKLSSNNVAVGDQHNAN